MAPAHAGGPTLPRPGEYLDTVYLEALARTHSPLAAAALVRRAHLPQQITVQAQGGGRRFAAVFDWHSGALLFVLQRNGWLRRDIAWGGNAGYALRVTGQAGFCVAAPGEAAQCYEPVRNVAARVAGLALAGVYRDRQGAEYRFSADGRAHFPGYDFTYAVGLEQTADRYDFFTIDHGARLMAFTRCGPLLTLYAVAPGPAGRFGTPDFAHKLAVLRAADVKVLASR